jgi:hypothetical protein
MNKATNVYIFTITCDGISTSSLIVFSKLFIQMSLFSPKSFEAYVIPEKPLHLRCYITSNSAFISPEINGEIF